MTGWAYFTLSARKALRKLDPRRRLYIDPVSRGQSVYLASSARSGSTWVQEILNADKRARVMFEPMRIEDVPLVREFAQRQYLRPDNTETRFIEPVTAIVNGRIRNTWVDQFNRKFIANGRIIKDVRSNLLLGWLREKFPSMPIVLLMRHPCAVAVSRRERGFETHLDVYTSQEPLVEDHLLDKLELIDQVESEFGKHVLMWCIENAVPLRQLKNRNVYVLFYEKLCVDPERTVRDLFDYVGVSGDASSQNRLQRVISAPSLLSRKGSAVLSSEDLVSAWQKQVSQEDLNVAMKCLEAFGLTSIYSSGSMPLVETSSGAFEALR